MTLSDLGKLRLTAPFVIAEACAVPYVILESGSTLAAGLIALVVAGIYVSFGLRNILWRRETDKYVGSQIRETLLALIPADLQVTDDEKATLSREDIFKQLTGVFWEAIDRDTQLTAHKQHFYRNGFVYTTAIDTAILSLLGGVVYLGVSVWQQEAGVAAVGVGMVVVSALAYLVALPSARQRHLSLSAEQLDLLRRNQRDFIEARFREIILARRAGRAT